MQVQSQPKTITTFLVDWSPTGIKTIELSNWIGKAIIIPRSKLKEAKIRSETQQPAIYFLFGDDEDGNKKAYIGEAENLINRISNHDWNKDFWETVIAFISKDNNLNKADVKFLEANIIQKALKSKRYSLLNNTEPILNNLAEHQKATMLEFMDNIDILLSAVGYPILKEVSSKSELDKWEKIYYYKDSNRNRGGCDAKWIYTDEWFLMLKWSRWPIKLQDHVIENKGKALKYRPKLIDQWIIVEEWNSIVFTQDHLFDSPSWAWSVISWGNPNWRSRWKDENWKTLDENVRKLL